MIKLTITGRDGSQKVFYVPEGLFEESVLKGAMVRVIETYWSRLNESSTNNFYIKSIKDNKDKSSSIEIVDLGGSDEAGVRYNAGGLLKQQFVPQYKVGYAVVGEIQTVQDLRKALQEDVVRRGDQEKERKKIEGEQEQEKERARAREREKAKEEEKERHSQGLEKVKAAELSRQEQREKEHLKRPSNKKYEELLKKYTRERAEEWEAGEKSKVSSSLIPNLMPTRQNVADVKSGPGSSVAARQGKVFSSYINIPKRLRSSESIVKIVVKVKDKVNKIFKQEEKILFKEPHALLGDAPVHSEHLALQSLAVERQWRERFEREMEEIDKIETLRSLGEGSIQKDYQRRLADYKATDEEFYALVGAAIERHNGNKFFPVLPKDWNAVVRASVKDRENAFKQFERSHPDFILEFRDKFFKKDWEEMLKNQRDKKLGNLKASIELKLKKPRSNLETIYRTIIGEMQYFVAQSKKRPQALSLCVRNHYSAFSELMKQVKEAEDRVLQLQRDSYPDALLSTDGRVNNRNLSVSRLRGTAWLEQQKESYRLALQKFYKELDFSKVDWVKKFQKNKDIAKLMREAQIYKNNLDAIPQKQQPLNECVRRHYGEFSELMRQVKEAEDRVLQLPRNSYLDGNVYLDALLSEDERVTSRNLSVLSLSGAAWLERQKESYRLALQKFYKELDLSRVDWVAEFKQNPDLAKLMREAQIYKNNLNAIHQKQLRFKEIRWCKKYIDSCLEGGNGVLSKIEEIKKDARDGVIRKELESLEVDVRADLTALGGFGEIIAKATSLEDAKSMRKTVEVIYKHLRIQRQELQPIMLLSEIQKLLRDVPFWNQQVSGWLGRKFSNLLKSAKGDPKLSVPGVPDGVSQMIDVINGSGTVQQKLEKIKGIAQSRLGSEDKNEDEGVLGRFKRSKATKQFYELLKNMDLEADFQQELTDSQQQELADSQQKLTGKFAKFVSVHQKHKQRFLTGQPFQSDDTNDTKPPIRQWHDDYGVNNNNKKQKR